MVTVAAAPKVPKTWTLRSWKPGIVTHSPSAFVVVSGLHLMIRQREGSTPAACCATCATLDGNAKKGFTQPIANGNGEIVKQFIFVPAKLKHDFLRLCMTVHEFIHAAGLDNGDHSDDVDPDVFCATLTPSGIGVQAGLFANRIMPPIWMTKRTGSKIQALW